MKKTIFLLLVLLIVVFAYYFIVNSQNRWTLVGESTTRGQYRIDGYKTSKECLEKALELSKGGDYYNCGKDCIDDSKKADGIRCKEYCGPGGCANVGK